MSEEEIVAETENTIDLCVGEAVWVNARGMMFLEKDFKVSGEVWRILKATQIHCRRIRMHTVLEALNGS